MSGKIKLFQKLASALNPGGALIIGGSESLAGLARDFIPRHYLNGVYYQLRKSAVSSTGEKPQLIASPPAPKPKPVDIIPKPRKLGVTPPKPKPSAIDRKLLQKEVKKSPPLPPKPFTKPQPVPEPVQTEVNSGNKISLLDKLNQKKPTHTSLLNEGKDQTSDKSSLLEKLKEKEKKKVEKE
jgi:hypothetical protein